MILVAIGNMKMAGRGRGRRGRPQGTGQAPPVFGKQDFAEAVVIAVAAIAQASVAGSQGGPSNLQRIKAHHPPSFTGGRDPMVVDHHWFMQIEKVLEAMEITSEATRIRLAAFQLESEAQIWGKWTRTSRDLRGAFVCELSPRDNGENRYDMSRLRVGDLRYSTHSGPEGHGHVRVRCHPGDGLADDLQDRYRL